MGRRLKERGGFRGALATGAAVAILLCGVALIGVAFASQGALPRLVAPRESATTLTVERQEQRARPMDGHVKLPRSKPVTLDIPAIDVHSVIRDVGVTADGALETPKPGPYYNDAAWYRHSPTPGEIGPSILLGHVDSAADGPSVFFRLGDLRRGDRISVTRADGSVTSFVVDEVQRYPKDGFPTDLVYGDIDHAGLRILTCGGPFDEVAGHYLDNIVVFASLVTT